MANVNAPRGLVPYRHWDGSVWNGSANLYYASASYGTALYIGDPVDIKSGQNDSFGNPAVNIATSTSPCLGVVVGIVSYGAAGAPGTMLTVTRDLPIYRPASTAQYVLVADDPTLLYWIQDDGVVAAGGFNPNTWPGKNANFISGSGSTITGYSGYMLSGTSVATTNTLDLKIMRQLDQADNLIATTANNTTVGYAKWLVKLNNLRTANLIAGVT